MTADGEAAMDSLRAVDTDVALLLLLASADGVARVLRRTTAASLPAASAARAALAKRESCWRFRLQGRSGSARGRIPDARGVFIIRGSP